ncbi:heparin lyase I family protein [Nitrobacter sp.]|uniref:heparin lyase I family protein n=1 Tax=Nitrobacter sp. TaxID=29420 RepID=UPI00399D7799
MSPLSRKLRKFGVLSLCGGIIALVYAKEALSEQSGLISSLAFSLSDTIDTSKFSNRDLSKPFYFRIHGPAEFGSYPFTVDIGSHFNVWLDERIPARRRLGNNARSLAISLTSKDDRNVKDKIFLNAVPHQSSQHTLVSSLDNERFISFDMMLDKSYQVPRYWLIHFQAYQCCAGHPILVMRVNPVKSNDKEITLELAVSSDESERAAYGRPIVVGSFSVQRERWFHVVLDLEPAPCGVRNGKVQASVDGVSIANWSGCWGYRPDRASVVEHGKITQNIGFDIGIYRRRQPTTQTIYVDNILYGTTSGSVSR